MSDRNPARFRVPIQKQQELAFPGVAVAMLVNLFLFISSFAKPLTDSQALVLMGLGIFGIFYIILTFFLIIPILGTQPAFRWFTVFLNSLVIIIILLLDQNVPVEALRIFTLSIIVIMAILSGRWPTYIFVAIISAAEYISTLLGPGGLTQFNYLGFLIPPFSAILITETVHRLQGSLEREMKRLQTLNRVARDLSTSLEMHQVLTLISSAIQNALDADTYYVGLVNGNQIQLELFYDDGDFFPPMAIALENTLAGQVIAKRKPMLIRNLVEEKSSKKLNYRIVGKPKVSHSWMGTTLEFGKNNLGLIAVASYQKNAFDEQDLELLTNIAQQAALTLDNAEHHAEVERKSKLDSLTGVLNHNYFISGLEQAAKNALVTGQSLGLIMLDIDHFKKYNDTYGHLIGDQVLRVLTETIQKNTKSTDLVGRWGGEEFAIGLLNASGPQTSQIARRIQTTLARMKTYDRDGKPIDAPTVSQGIAIFPSEETDIYSLIDLADQRLYEAKARGRNQVEPAEGYWEISDNLQTEPNRF